jgi:hypothetical protein
MNVSLNVQDMATKYSFWTLRNLPSIWLQIASSVALNLDVGIMFIGLKQRRKECNKCQCVGVGLSL